LPWRFAVKFVRPRQVLEMIGVSRTTLWRLVQSGGFPAPVRITQRNSGYVLEAVEEWMKARAAGVPWQAPTPKAEPPRTPPIAASPPLVLARSGRRNQ
jgi:prophage regulatory protein